MILRPLATTVSDYTPSQILLFFSIYKIKMRAMLSLINTNLFLFIFIPTYIYVTGTKMGSETKQ